MKIKIALAALFLSTPALAQQTPVCSYGQTCPPGGVQVPFPVVNPFQGLNVLNQQLRQQQPSPPPAQYQAPVATPPPVLPPGYQR